MQCARAMQLFGRLAGPRANSLHHLLGNVVMWSHSMMVSFFSFSFFSFSFFFFGSDQDELA